MVYNRPVALQSTNFQEVTRDDDGLLVNQPVEQAGFHIVMGRLPSLFWITMKIESARSTYLGK